MGALTEEQMSTILRLPDHRQTLLGILATSGAIGLEDRYVYSDTNPVLGDTKFVQSIPGGVVEYHYLRPASSDRYLRPDGVSTYIRP